MDIDDSYDGSDQDTLLTVGDYAKEMSWDAANNSELDDIVAAIYLNMGEENVYSESAE